MEVRLVELSPADLRSRMSDALAVYVAAMGYSEGTQAHRAPMWAEHALRPHWKAVAALDGSWESGRIVGITYGYRTCRGQWWSEEVRSGLLGAGAPPAWAQSALEGAFELTELHVEPGTQGHGVGQRLLLALLEGRPEARAVLSTPEVPGEANRAWRLYRRWGFTDLLRNFRFTGDARAFAVLAAELPLHRTGP